MEYRKTNPVGIDKRIDRIQHLLFNGLDWTNYDSYHRVYLNETGDEKAFEFYLSENEYKDVLYDDRKSATSFFTTKENSNKNGTWSNEISIIFQLNLAELYPLIGHRADEEAHRDVINVLEKNGFDITSKEVGIRNVYSDMGYGKGKFEDLEPFHVFKININLEYEYRCY